jgi:hypothetical protein
MTVPRPHGESETVPAPDARPPAAESAATEGATQAATETPAAPTASAPQAPQAPEPHPAVAAALGRLEQATRLPLSDRPAELEAVHAALADALGAVEGT